MSTRSIRLAQKNAALVKKDKIDILNRNNTMHSNFIKWWNVKVEYPEDDFTPQEEAMNLATMDLSDIPDERARAVVANALSLNDNSNVFAELMASGVAREFIDEEKKSADDILEEANAIFERLQREAAEDDAKRRSEIEEAKRLANA